MLVYALVLHFYVLQNIDMETEEIQDLSAETVESLMTRKRDECQIRSLRYGGNKTELVNRLMQFQCNVVEGNIDPQEEIPDPLLSGVISSWLMKPKMTTSMKIGAMNESNILPRISQFWELFFLAIRLCVGFHEHYITPILHTFSNKLPWVYNNNIAVPNLSKANLGYFGDMDVLTQHLNLWRALTLAVLQNQKPFPPAKQIIPYITSVWNRTKGGVDVYSSMLKHIQAQHSKLDPQAAVFLRILKSMFYNSYQTWRCIAGFSLVNTAGVTDYTTFETKNL